MKKTVLVLVSLLALLFGACSQIPGFTPTPGTGPTVNPDDHIQDSRCANVDGSSYAPIRFCDRYSNCLSPPLSFRNGNRYAPPVPSTTDTPSPMRKP